MNRIRTIQFLFLALFILLGVNILPSKTYEITYKKITGIISMYNPIESQTDESPLITASGALVDSRTAACPLSIPFHTKIRIDGVEYTCTDRMAKRYRDAKDKNYFDLISPSVEHALNYGRQKKVVEILIANAL